MATETENARVTELHIRMDCNGCAQRIKKTLHSVDGVQNVYVDIHQQKLTVVGRAEPEMLVKAIKKTRKTATIFSQTDPGGSDPSGTEQPPPNTDTPTPQESEAPSSEADPPPQAQNNAPAKESPPPAEPDPSPETQNPGPDESKDVEEVHMVHNYPYNYYPTNGHEIHQEVPYSVTHSYNTYRPMPNVSEYGYAQPNPQDGRYDETEYHRERYYQNRSSDENQITSMFSDENPNACTIV